MAANPALVGVERSKARARLHKDRPERQIDPRTGAPKLEEMRPQPVVLTLRDELAPTFTVHPGPHPTRVVLPALEGQKVGALVAELPAGTGATFVVTGTKPLRSGDQSYSALVWARAKTS
jgi:hypothetical protein